MSSSSNWWSWKSCRCPNVRRASINSQRITSRLTLSHKNLPRRRRVKLKAAATRDDIRIVPPQFGDAVLGGECRHLCGPANLGAAGDGDHDGRFLLTFLRRL